MRLVTGLIATIGLLGVLLAGPTSPAQADSCPAEEYLFSSSSSNPPFQCGVHHWSGNKSIAAWATKSWSSDTAVGYSFKTKCKYKSDSDLTYVWGYSGPSYYITFTNWEGGTRHFASGVIFATGSVNSDEYSGSNDCANNDGKIKNSLKKVTSAATPTIGGELKAGGTVTLTGTISPSDSPGNVALYVDGVAATSNGNVVGAKVSSGKYTIKWVAPANADSKTYKLSVAYSGDTSNCKKAGSWCGWSPAESKKVSVTIAGSSASASSASTSSLQSSGSPNSPLVGNPVSSPASVSADSGQDPGTKLINVSARMPKKLGAKCPDGYWPLNAELWGGDSSRLLNSGKFGVTLKRGAIADGRRAGIQLTCRKGGKSLMNRGKIGFGTPKNDYMKTKAEGALLLGGVSDDALVVSRKNGVANGGRHDDLITLRNSGVAIGGHGDDMLRSLTSKRTLLVGGAGRDLIAARGKARIDARDGEADRIVCRGKRVRVKADRHDHLKGRCIQV